MVVVHGEENDVAEFLDLIAAFSLNADEFFFCHRRLLSVGTVLILYNIIKYTGSCQGVLKNFFGPGRLSRIKARKFLQALSGAPFSEQCASKRNKADTSCYRHQFSDNSARLLFQFRHLPNLCAILQNQGCQS